MYDVKSLSQPDIMPILENNYCLQIIEKKGGVVLGLSQDGACTDLLENLSVNIL